MAARRPMALTSPRSADAGRRFPASSQRAGRIWARRTGELKRFKNLQWTTAQRPALELVLCLFQGANYVRTIA